MGLVDMAKKIKDVHPTSVIMFKSGNFYKTFGKDAYIISNLFGYNMQMVNGNVYTCGFPLNTINKVVNKLEESKIDYMQVDVRNEYDVDSKKEFGNLNNYEEIFKKSYSINKHKKDINKIVEELEYYIDKPNFKDIIRKVEDILDENREI